jgi:hypothetical protein
VNIRGTRTIRSNPLKLSNELKKTPRGTVVDQNKIGQSVTLDSFTIQRFV